MGFSATCQSLIAASALARMLSGSLAFALGFSRVDALRFQMDELPDVFEKWDLLAAGFVILLMVVACVRYSFGTILLFYFPTMLNISVFASLCLLNFLKTFTFFKQYKVGFSNKHWNNCSLFCNNFTYFCRRICLWRCQEFHSSRDIYSFPPPQTTI